MTQADQMTPARGRETANRGKRGKVNEGDRKRLGHEDKETELKVH